MDTEKPTFPFVAAPKQIAFVIHARYETVYVKDARLEKWLQSTHTSPISLYILIKPTAEERQILGFRPQVIISKLRATYQQTGVRFSVLSEKHGRMLICVSSSKRTTELLSPCPSPSGPESTSNAESPSGPGPFPNGIDDLWPSPTTE